MLSVADILNQVDNIDSDVQLAALFNRRRLCATLAIYRDLVAAKATEIDPNHTDAAWGRFPNLLRLWQSNPAGR